MQGLKQMGRSSQADDEDQLQVVSRLKGLGLSVIEAAAVPCGTVLAVLEAQVAVGGTT